MQTVLKEVATASVAVMCAFAASSAVAASNEGRGAGEEDRDPSGYQKEQVANRAYPGVDIPFELSEGARLAFGAIASQSASAPSSQWRSLGPQTALYPDVLNRTSASYVASGRVSAMAVEPGCSAARCRLYIGAAGGGIWRSDDALSDSP